MKYSNQYYGQEWAAHSFQEFRQIVLGLSTYSVESNVGQNLTESVSISSSLHDIQVGKLLPEYILT